MKKPLLLLLPLFIYLSPYAAPVIKAVNNGFWGNTAVWDLNRLPQVGDTIVIPAGKAVIINGDFNLNGAVYLRLNGIMTFLDNNSTLNLGTMSTVMVNATGTILGGGSASQRIRIGTASVFKGNEPSITGPRMANYTTGTGFILWTGSALPVTFTQFIATRKSGVVLLQWTASGEKDTHMYEVESSLDGASWTTVGNLLPAVNGQTVHHYAFTDNNTASGTLHYRIRQVDKVGGYSYSPTRTLSAVALQETVPVEIRAGQGRVVLQFSRAIETNLVVRFISLQGRIVDQQVVGQGAGQVVINTKAKGACIVSVSNGQDLQVARQIIL